LSDTLSDFLPIVLFVGLIALRWWLGHLIGTAAMRRGRGFMGWVVCSLIFGPLIVWIVYLIFVHSRPPVLLPQLRDADPIDPPDESSTQI
jgi:hypothetical protein